MNAFYKTVFITVMAIPGNRAWPAHRLLTDVTHYRVLDDARYKMQDVR